MTTGVMTKGTAVFHAKFGRGRVLLDEGDAVVVRFDGGIESCTPGELQILPDVESETGLRAGPPLRVLTRVLAAAIRSVNDTWGVFSNSRVDLLPHQLWVCRRVLERWPTRWLVADDVGLGKTIEAGLILTPLVSSGRVRRLLVLTPASLVEQWQLRLRQLFDLRVARYTSEADTAKSDFWGTHPAVIASAQTLRADKKERWKRLLEAPAWDLVLVDEAHHVNSDEKGGPTLAWQLIAEMQRRGKIESMVFFTGTPHRGKDFGFLSLLSLLWPERFDSKRPMEDQLAGLRDVMIRNNKRLVTDMNGNRLFQKVQVETISYEYSHIESSFYRILTEYISSGRAYASKLGSGEQRTAMLVLTAMQKLASSSVAAVRRALAGRLMRLEEAEQRRSVRKGEVDELRNRLKHLQDEDDPADNDLRAELEEKLAALASDVPLLPKEIPAIRELLNAAELVGEETKIQRIIDILEQRFKGRSVLLFTEYKATQALVMTALRARFGDDCVTFINGDERLEGVLDATGRPQSIAILREEAARRFNEGEVRFLVSTEAAGEGIDLQRMCHSLIHVDLPWNPMRLHQRVGRVDRYGQRHPVEVINLWNPETVEGRIWQCLDEKLRRITAAFGAAMDEPEDMLQLVLGMSTSGQFERLFIDARDIPKERLSSWFDEQTATFGGRRAVDVVRELVGNAARFDFGTEKAGLPRVDLPDLLPFFRAMLTLSGRKADERGSSLSFLTPDSWQKADFTVAPRYDELQFVRSRPGGSTSGVVAGVGLRIVDVALQIAEAHEDVLAVIPALATPIVVFAVRDAVTTNSGVVRRLVFGVGGAGANWHLILDWGLIQLLNGVCGKPLALHRLGADRLADLTTAPSEHVSGAREWLAAQLHTMALPFAKPRLDTLVLLAPEVGSRRDITPEASSLSAQATVAAHELARHLGEQPKWNEVNAAIWGAFGGRYGPVMRFSDLSRLARQVGADFEDVMAALNVLSAPSVGLIDRRYVSSNGEVVESEEVGAKLRAWWSDKSLSEEDWKRWSGSVFVEWRPRGDIGKKGGEQ